MKRGYKKGMPKDYELKPCPYCGEDISPLNRNGKRMPPAKYDERKTCGGSDCWSESLLQRSQQKLKPKLFKHSLTPENYFLYGVTA